MEETREPNDRDRRLQAGSSYSFSRVITEDMIDDFARLSGDYNPVHMDEDFCRQHKLGHRIAHGMLVLSLVSAMIGMYLPGPGSVWLSQSFDFIRPVRIGDELTVTGKVLDIKRGGILGNDIITMAITAHNDADAVIARGKAVVTVK
jgi:3-hydroxybutyryl-CoA dehydratase